jgi:hypothetical protein
MHPSSERRSVEPDLPQPRETPSPTSAPPPAVAAADAKVAEPSPLSDAEKAKLRGLDFLADVPAEQQAGGSYDPKAKKFFLVMVPSSDLMLDTITAHELTHALQDQHFDLQAYYASKDKQQRPLGDDALHARRFIVEGEATLTMLVYAHRAGSWIFVSCSRPWRDQPYVSMR